MSASGQGLGEAAISSASVNLPADTNDGNELEEVCLSRQLSFADADYLEEEEVDEDTDGPKCEKLLEKNRNSLKLLLAMAIGCVPRDDSIANMEAEPFKSNREKRSFSPTADVLKGEVIRRGALFQLKPTPRPKGWTLVTLRQWLTLNPIRNKVDKLCLQKEERELRAAKLSLALTEREDKLQEKQTEESWCGPMPCLRLCHVLMEDDVRVAYVQRHDTPARDAFDARNCDERPLTFYELAAKQFNSPEFNPTTNTCADLHSNFTEPIELRFDLAPAPVTAMKIKDKLGELRSNLVQVSPFVSALPAMIVILLINLCVASSSTSGRVAEMAVANKNMDKKTLDTLVRRL
jgi:hypothetical protein